MGQIVSKTNTKNDRKELTSSPNDIEENVRISSILFNPRKAELNLWNLKYTPFNNQKT